MDYHIIKELVHLLVSKWNRATRRSLKMPKNAFACRFYYDYSWKTRLLWPFYHGERSGIKLHVSYTPQTETPVQIVETTRLLHNGPVGEQLVDPQFILVEDQTYFKIKRIDQFTKEKQAFVIRMKENVEIINRNRYEERNSQNHLYKVRWKIETFFRWIKQNLNVPVLFGMTKNAVFNQLFAALIAFVLLKWMYKKAREGHIFTKLSFVSFQRLLLKSDLPIDWKSELAVVINNYQTIHGIGLSDFG